MSEDAPQSLKSWFCEQASMRHEDPTVFARSQWQKDKHCRLWYLVVRWFIALFFCISLMYSMSQIEEQQHLQIRQKVKWFIYLTNWAYALDTTQAVLALTMVASLFNSEKNPGGTQNCGITPKMYQIYWANSTIATDLAFSVTLVYWWLIHIPPITLNGFNVHVLNSVFMFCDLCIAAHPIRMLHCYWTILVGLLYFLFNVSYYYAGGTTSYGERYIYDIMNWERPLFCVGVSFGIVCLTTGFHLIAYVIYLLKCYIHKTLVGRVTIEADSRYISTRRCTAAQDDSL